MSTLATKVRANLRVVSLVFLAALLQLSHPTIMYGQHAGPRYFESTWWSNSSHDEHIGFLYALDDCLSYDVKPAMRFNDTWDNYEKKISDYYASPSTDQTVSVDKVFKQYGKALAKNGTMRLTERYGDEFWRAHNDTVRRGFLEGYFSCHSGSTSRWPKTLDFYLERLNDLYNVDDRMGENAPEYTGSLASAIENLGDHR